MKFTGQVRIPEVDHPGVPGTIVVDGDQTEVFLEGESLGRWSLYDVQASRLVSAAFSISLAGEEITFIADEPVDFAYKGVDHMAEVWARYKSMTIPRRVVAVGRSRRGTLPSRISELREAMLQNLEAAGRVTTLRPKEALGEAPMVPSSWTKRIDAYSKVPAPIEDDGDDSMLKGEAKPPVVEIVSADDRVAAVIEPPPAGRSSDEVQPDAGRDSPPEEPQPPEPSQPAARMRPGPGLIPRRRQLTAAAESEALPDQSVVETPSVEVEPEVWSDQPVGEEAATATPEVAPARPESVIERDRPTRSPAPAEELEPQPSEPYEAERSEKELPEPEPETLTISGEKGELPPAGDEDGEGEPVTLPEPGDPRPQLVVDLGRLEEISRDEDETPLPSFAGTPDSRGENDDEDEPGSPEPEVGKEPAYAGAPAPSSPAPERSGLLGAVRSAFARNRSAHVHEFVEAPGGIGIVRQICSECGYISIGVSD